MPLILFDSVTINAATRTAIRAIADCDVITLTNQDAANDVTLYDAETAGGSKTLRAAESLELRRHERAGSHWRVLDVILWAQASAGTGPISVQYLL